MKLSIATIITVALLAAAATHCILLVIICPPCWDILFVAGAAIVRPPCCVILRVRFAKLVLLIEMVDDG